MNSDVLLAMATVPPSPFVSQTIVDVRSSVRNTGSGAVSARVSFYLDGESVDSLLHQEEIFIESGKVSGSAFKWSATDIFGHHTIKMVAEIGGEVYQTSTEVCVVRPGDPSLGTLSGSWLAFYHWCDTEARRWNADIKKLTDGQWGTLVQDMNAIGMDIIVIQEMFRNQEYYGKHSIEQKGYCGKAFYPSGLYAGRMDQITASDPMEAVFAEADKLGMKIFAGVGIYAWFDFTKGSLEWHKRVADELLERYGHHPSFYGWYVGEEAYGNLENDPVYQSEIVGFFSAFTAHCRERTPEKPVMLAPNCFNVAGAKEAWAELLKHCDIIAPFGFHRMPEGDLSGQEAATLFRQMCDEAGAHLWMDLETFSIGGDGVLYPRDIGDIVGDITRYDQFEKILCYQYPGLMSSPENGLVIGGEETIALYNDYKGFLDTNKGK